MESSAAGPGEAAVGLFLDHCYRGDQAAIVAMLEKGVDVNASDAVYTTPLQLAAASGHEGIVQLLVRRGARLEAANLYGWTALMHAARHGHAGVVCLLLQRGADVRRRNRLGATPLTLAAVSGHLSTVRALLEAAEPPPPPPPPADHDLPAECPLSPTLAAALHGNNSVLRLLLDHGGELGTPTADTGLTALMLAAVGGHRSTCRILLERGADPNVRNTRGQTALDMARVGGKRQVCRVLDEKTAEPDPAAEHAGAPLGLHEAVRRRDLRLAGQLLSSDGAEAGQLSPEGGTPLMLAALDGQTEMAALLLRHGAAVNQQDATTGWTALMQAVFHNHPAMVKLLLSSGADANVRAHNGCTAFDLASLVDSKPDMIRLLAACTYKYTPPVPAAGLQGAPPAPLCWQSRAVSTPSLQDRGLKAWWSRMSSRFQHVKPRVEPVVALGVRSIPEEPAADRNSSSAPKMTLESVLPASKRIKGRMPQGFPSRSLSSDTLRPVLPPFCCERAGAANRCSLPPPLHAEPAHCPATDGADMAEAIRPGGHLNTFRLLRYLRSPNSSPSNSFSRRRRFSPGPHSSGDSGLGTSARSSADNSCLRAKVSPGGRSPIRSRQKPQKKLSVSRAAAPPSPIAAVRAAPSGRPQPTAADHQTVGKLTYLLRSLGLAHYGSVFDAQEIDFEAFVDLSAADLKELGIQRKDRDKFSLVIRELRTKLRA